MARCCISNPRKLRKIRELIGRDFEWISYRGGHWDKNLGHLFVVHPKNERIGDTRKLWVNSDITKYGTFTD